MMQHKKRPIIAFGGNSWDPYWQTRQHVLSRLASRGWPVVYSIGSFFVWDRFGEAWSGARWRDRWEVLDGVRVYWPGRWQMRWPRVPAWDRWVVRHHVDAMRQIAALEPNVRPIVYLFRPTFLPYAAALGACTTVYHADDNFSLMARGSGETVAAQAALLERSDLVVASSRRVAQALGQREDVRVLPNGADVAAFASAAEPPCPDDLAKVPRPRVAYVGFLNEKVDFPLVYSIATAQPAWHWVFVGPEVGDRHLSERNRTNRAWCRALPNVHFLGKKPHTDVHAYMRHADVNVMCYRAEPGGWWTDIYPLKLHEYLAVGKPVVSSAIDSVREFAEVVAIAESADDWITLLRDAIERGGVGTRGQRQLIANLNSWDSRINTLEAWLRELA
jgi:glycosyltransferase involved in cell wall biosynthesis